MAFQGKTMRALRVLGALLLAAGSLVAWKLWRAHHRVMDVRVMSFNIRNGQAKDEDNSWPFRKDFVCNVIRGASADVIGIQEAYRFQLDHLREHLPDYAEVGSGRDGGENGEYACILYRKDRFKVADSGTFWLSDTPHVPSATWGNDYRRVCSWARLVDRRTQRPFTVYNTHLDHQSPMAREKGVSLIMRTIASRPSADPFILCGDLNAGEDSKIVAYLKGREALKGVNPIPLVDTWRVIHPEDPACGTVSRFNGSMEPYKIDYILAPRGTEVLAAAILRTQRDGRYPSDHYPVTAHLRFEQRMPVFRLMHTAGNR